MQVKGVAFLSFISLEFFLFFAVSAVVYFVLPHKFRWIWLLAASCFFYLCYNPWYAIFLGVSTLVTYASGLLIGKSARLADPVRAARQKKIWVALSFCINIGILSVFKYLNLFSEIGAGILSLTGVPTAAAHFDLLLPVGISFYTFQALSYTVDVYRGDVPPERHLGKYALFVSFFPQVTSGPIEKSKNFLPQLDEVHIFDYDRARRGVLLMLWGYFQKMVVADRLGVLVDTVYGDQAQYYGLASIVAVIFYAFQIYCDFAGYTNIAIGAAEVMGFRLTTNFDRPYFSRSIQEFWRRWHISLGSWFKDYLYIPLGGSRCSAFRRCLNLMTVFVVCGLWHGDSVNFLIWGALHGLYQVAGLLSKRLRKNIRDRLGIGESSGWYRALQTAFTFLLVSFAWIFFRAETLPDAAAMIGNLFRFNPASLRDGSLFSLGLTQPEFLAAVLGIFVVAAVDFIKRRWDLRSVVLGSNAAVRWSVYLTAALMLAVFGTYGSEYNAQQFIYTKF